MVLNRTGIAIRNIDRPSQALVDALGEHGVATLHEAQQQTGLLAPELRPLYRGARLCGSAITVSLPPADNLMIHVALELCRPGDVLVVAPTSPSDAGYFGDLLATSAQTRGVKGAVIDGGCRDIAGLTDMAFPVWSRHVSATGTVKETLGTVNLPVVCAGQSVRPGDVVVADDDGVVVVPRTSIADVLDVANERDAKESQIRKRYRAGELSLDVHGMRENLAEKGLTYLDSASDLP